MPTRPVDVSARLEQAICFAELLPSLGCQCLHDVEIGQQSLRQIVPLFQILRVVLRDPHFSLGVLCDQNFQRKVDGDARGCQHQRRAALRIAEDQELGGRHF